MNEATLSTTETVSLCFLLVIRPCLSPPPPPKKKKNIEEYEYRIRFDQKLTQHLLYLFF